MAITKVSSALIGANTIATGNIADNAVDGTKIAQNSILTRHIDDAQITTGHIIDANVTTAKIADDAVSLAKLAGLARGKIIYGDASGNPAALALGSNGTVLKSDGTDIAWATDATVAALTSEEVQDIAGAMFSSNTETGITATYQDADGTIDLVVGTLNQNTTGSAATLTTARTIGGTSFDGSANIAVGLAATATTLATARTIGGVSFDGSANINLPGVNSAGNQNVDAALVDGENFKINGAQGSDGQVLTSTGSGVAWEAAAGGGVSGLTNNSNATWMTVDSAEQVGIGTASPAARLHVDGMVAGEMAFYIEEHRNDVISGDAALCFVDVTDSVAPFAAFKIANAGTGPALLIEGDIKTLTAGTSNFVAGVNAGESIESGGNYNVVIGDDAGKVISTGDDNTAVGYRAMVGTTTGFSNVVLGTNAMDTATTANNNISIGTDTLAAATTGDANIAIGKEALMNLAGAYHNNIAIGFNAMKTTTGDTGNIAIGAYAMDGYNSRSSTQCIAIGYGSMGGALAGYGNTAVGDSTMTVAAGAFENTCIGRNALVALTSGSNNTAVGSYAGDALTTGSNNTSLGYQADPTGATVSNEFTLGNSSVSALRCADTSIAALSDRRDKKDIIDSSYGLEFINKIRPVQFTWDRRNLVKGDLESVHNGKTRIGFISQELQEAMEDDSNEILDLVYEENPERLEVKQGKLIPVLTKAVQELSAKVEELENKLNNKEK